MRRHQHRAAGGPPRRKPRGRGPWAPVDRVFFRVLKVLALVAGIGVAFAMLREGKSLEALLVTGAVLYVLGVGPFRYLLGPGPRQDDDEPHD